MPDYRQIADWFAQPGLPKQGLLAEPSSSGFQSSYQAPNRLAVIGRLLSAAGKGYTGTLSGPQNQQGFAVANALGNASDELANIQSTDYQAKRQEMIDRMEWDKAHAQKSAKRQTSILPPGAIMTDAAGNILRENPLAPKEKEPKEATGDALMVEKLSQGDPEKAREIWQQILADKVRPPRDPVTNINMPKPQFIETDEGIVYAEPGGKVSLVHRTPPKEEKLRELSAKELSVLSEGEDQIAGAAAAREGIKRAQELNELAAGGPLVPITKYIDYATNTDRFNATQDLDNLIKRNVLARLKETFGGQGITDKEQQVLSDVEGSSSQPTDVRREIFKRAEQVYNESIERKSKRNEAIRNRTWTEPQAVQPNLYDGVPGAAPQAPLPPPVMGAPPMAGGAIAAPVAGAAPPGAPVIRNWNPATGKIE